MFSLVLGAGTRRGRGQTSAKETVRPPVSTPGGTPPEALLKVKERNSHRCGVIQCSNLLTPHIRASVASTVTICRPHSPHSYLGVEARLMNGINSRHACNGAYRCWQLGCRLAHHLLPAHTQEHRHNSRVPHFSENVSLLPKTAQQYKGTMSYIPCLHLESQNNQRLPQPLTTVAESFFCLVCKLIRASRA